jgi:uncharacterized phiE125 gp8 family phage protein
VANYNYTSVSAIEPISLDLAKTHCRIDGDAENDYLYSLITAARQAIENRTWLTLVSSTIKLVMDKNEVNEYIYINKTPVKQIVSVKYKDANGTVQTMSVNDYEVDLESLPARIRLKTIPNIGDYMAAFTVEFTAGYTDVSLIPKPVMQAILLTVGNLYENRESQVVGQTVNELKDGVTNLIQPYIQPNYFI